MQIKRTPSLGTARTKHSTSETRVARRGLERPHSSPYNAAARGGPDQRGVGR